MRAAGGQYLGCGTSNAGAAGTTSSAAHIAAHSALVRIVHCARPVLLCVVVSGGVGLRLAARRGIDGALGWLQRTQTTLRRPRTHTSPVHAGHCRDGWVSLALACSS